MSSFRFNTDVLSDDVFANTIIDFNNEVENQTNVHIGFKAGQTGQGTFAVAVGYQAGQIDQGFSSTAVGDQAGQINQGEDSVAVGQMAGQYNQGALTVAVGFQTGQTGQQYGAVAVGVAAGQTNQGTYCAALGTSAAQLNQGGYGVAIGYTAAQSDQQIYGTAIGFEAGLTFQGTSGIAIGYLAGQLNQQANAVAIGPQAGQTTQGSYSIAIGCGAAPSSQPFNNICLNASGTPFTPAATGLYIAPVNVNSSASVGTFPLGYNATTHEIFANAAKTFVITHPLDQTKYLVHGCLEGPESGVYYRGTAKIAEGQKSARVTLPKYCAAFDEFTAFAVPVCEDEDIHLRPIAVGKVRDNAFSVFSDGPGQFNWSVYARRANINIEISKNTAKLKGNGPYVWLEN